MLVHKESGFYKCALPNNNTTPFNVVRVHRRAISEQNRLGLYWWELVCQTTGFIWLSEKRAVTLYRKAWPTICQNFHQEHGQVRARCVPSANTPWWARRGKGEGPRNLKFLTVPWWFCRWDVSRVLYSLKLEDSLSVTLERALVTPRVGDQWMDGQWTQT